MAAPNRLMTLTVDPALYNAPRDAFEVTSPLVSELIRTLRKRFGEVEYLRVTEVTRAGWPHYHLLIRSKYLPQPVVQAEWNRLTGAKIVDLRKAQQCFKAYYYLAKYLSKMHKLDWTERHVSFSKSFFLRDTKPTWKKEAWIDTQRDDVHPVDYLLAWYQGQELPHPAPMHWILTGDASDTPATITPRKPVAEQPDTRKIPPPSQTTRTALCQPF